MLDVFNLPNNLLSPDTDVQMFVGRLQPSSGLQPSINEVQTWKKPRGIRMLQILCVGGGGGGGGGQSAIAGTNKTGGGGGGSSGLTSLIVPAFYLPDKLYILPGYGGTGGAADTNGITGNPSFIFYYPDSNFQSQNLLATSAGLNSQAGAGVKGAAGSPGTGGGGASAPTITTVQSIGVAAFFGGNSGASGGAAAGAGNSASWTTNAAFLFGGSGGGGSSSVTNGAGGGVTLTSFVGPVTEATPKAAAGGANPGSGGYLLRAPNYHLFGFGGLGSGGVDNAVGAAGGNGAPGCGGGGGGSGTTGGAGGNGGPGFVVITGW